MCKSHQDIHIKLLLGSNFNKKVKFLFKSNFYIVPSWDASHYSYKKDSLHIVMYTSCRTFLTELDTTLDCYTEKGRKVYFKRKTLEAFISVYKSYPLWARRENYVFTSIAPGNHHKHQAMYMNNAWWQRY